MKEPAWIALGIVFLERERGAENAASVSLWQGRSNPFDTWTIRCTAGRGGTLNEVRIDGAHWRRHTRGVARDHERTGKHQRGCCILRSECGLRWVAGRIRLPRRARASQF